MKYIEENIEREIASFVILGNFNPSIFHPMWFSKNGLISENEADGARILVIHPEIADIEVDWFKLQVTSNRFFLSTISAGEKPLLKDLIINICEILSHCPINALGINFEYHYKFDEKNFNKFKNIFLNDFIKNKFSEIGLKNIYLQKIAIGNMNSEELSKNLTISPSNLTNLGIAFNINNHFTQKDKATKDLVELIKKEWKDLEKESKKIIQGLINE